MCGVASWQHVRSASRQLLLDYTAFAQQVFLWLAHWCGSSKFFARLSEAYNCRQIKFPTWHEDNLLFATYWCIQCSRDSANMCSVNLHCHCDTVSLCAFVIVAGHGRWWRYWCVPAADRRSFGRNLTVGPSLTLTEIRRDSFCGYV